MKLTRDNTTALIVDIQEKIVPAMLNADALVQRSKFLLEGLAVHGIPIVSTRQYPKGLGETLEEIRSAMKNVAVFDKTTFSCLDTDEIRTHFALDSRPNVLLAGIEAHICILQTALDLMTLNKTVYLVADCVSSRSSFDMEIAIRRLFSSGVVLTTSESALFEITRDAKSPNFKAISRLATGR